MNEKVIECEEMEEEVYESTSKSDESDWESQDDAQRYRDIQSTTETIY